MKGTIRTFLVLFVVIAVVAGIFWAVRPGSGGTDAEQLLHEVTIEAEVLENGDMRVSERWDLALYDRGHHPLCLLRVRRAGRDAHKALGVLRVGREGGVRERIHVVAELILHLALAYAEEVYRVRGNHAVGEGGEDRPHAVLEHGLNLPRRAGQHYDHDALGREDAAGRGAPVVPERGRALGQHDLLEVVRRYLKARVVPLAPEASKPLLLALVEHEGEPEGLGNRVLREVVAGGAEAAGGYDELRAGFRALHGLYDAARIVAHHGLPVYVYAILAQQQGDVRRVGVYRGAEQQLGADGDYLSLQGLSISFRRPPRPRGRANLCPARSRRPPRP